MQESKHSNLLYISILVLIPIILLSINSNWIYNPPGFADHWFYWGYFQNPRLYIEAWFPDTYYGSRLSVILPGACVYKLFDPVTANLVLHLTYLLLSVLGVYVSVMKLFGNPVAFRTSLILMLNPYFLISIGSDYVDGAGIAYFSIAIAFLVDAIQRKNPGKSLAMSGFFSGCAFVSNIVWIAFILLLPCIFLFSIYKYSRAAFYSRTISVLVQFAIGFAALVIPLCFVNLYFGGRFLFLAPSFRFVRSTVQETNVCYSPFSAWFGIATWLSIPILTAIAAIFKIRALVDSQDTDRPEVACFQGFNLAFGIVLILYLVLHLIGIPFIQYWYYTSYFIPFEYIVLGPLLFYKYRLGYKDGLLSSMEFTVLVIVIGMVVLIPANWGTGLKFLPNLLLGDSAWVLVLIGAGLVLLGWFSKKNLLHITLVLLGWGLCNSSTAFILGKEMRLSNGALIFPNNQPVQCFGLGKVLVESINSTGVVDAQSTADSFYRISEAYKVIIQDKIKPLIWYSSKDKNFPEFKAIGSCFLRMYSLLNEDFPRIEKSATNPLAKKERLIFLSTDQITENRLNEALYTYGYSVRKLSEKEIKRGDVGYWIFIGRLVRIPPTIDAN